MNPRYPMMDHFSKQFFLGLGIIFVLLVFWWFYRSVTVIETFLKAAVDVLAGKRLSRMKLFYASNEVTGNYKGRDVVVGVRYSGVSSEFLPLPNIRMRLKESIGYNTNRLPNYASIEKGYLVYTVKISVLWGFFDKAYPELFKKNYLMIALEKMLATAEDVERGRTVKDIFK
jgi:hypothetical protein